MAVIIDISHHQDPKKMNYDKLAKRVGLVIIRTQYGSKTIDRHYKTHHAEFKKRGVPTAAYAWVRGVSVSDMEVEATDFYNRTKDLNPTFWFLDVEEESMKNMRAGVKAYVKKLRALGAKKVGVYIAHHLYKKFNLDMSDFDAIWIPRYGTNNGKPQIKPDFPCDIWQYTSVGRLDGYNGDLDLNMIISDKKLEYFTEGTKSAAPVKKVNSAKSSTKKTPKATSPDKSAAKGNSTIKYIQKTLNKRYNLGIAVDGVFGPQTKKALAKGLQTELNKQFDARLIVDGIFGPKTKQACPIVRIGAKGNITWLIQAALYVHGYDPKGIDGIFGKRTANAILKFQKYHKLTQDAIVGPQTFEKLFD